MGLGSLLGVWIGTALLGMVDARLLRGLLGVILLLASLSLLVTRRLQHS